MRNLKSLTLALIISSLAISPAHADRHGAGGPFDHDSGGMGQVEALTQALDLTPQQATEIRAMLAESREAMASGNEESRANRQALREVFAAASLDESHLRALLQKQAELQADRMVARHAALARVNQLLTPEQQAKQEQFRQQRHERRGGPGKPGRCLQPDVDKAAR